MTPITTRLTRMIALLGTAGFLAACSVQPTYEVRVTNESRITVVAALRRDRAMQDDQVLAQARLRPGEQATLGPADADPLDPVELVIARPEDVLTSPVTNRLSRGVWNAVVSDAAMDSWQPVGVALTKD